MENKPMVGDCTFLNRNILLQILFHGFNALAIRKSQPVGYPENMGVYSDNWLIVNN